MQDPRSLGQDYRPGWLSLHKSQHGGCSKDWTIKAYCFRERIRWCLQTVLKGFFEQNRSIKIRYHKEFQTVLTEGEAMATHLGLECEGFWLPSVRQSQWNGPQPLRPGTTDTQNATSTGLLISLLNWVAFRKTEADRFRAKSMLCSFLSRTTDLQLGDTKLWNSLFFSVWSIVQVWLG